MSGSSSPSGGRPEKTMSSRLLTMKFMQRSAASHPPSLSSTPTSNTQQRELNGHAAKRQKLSPSIPPSPNNHYPPTPGSQYQSDDPRTPLSQERSAKFTSQGQSRGGNTAETPWVLNDTSDLASTRQKQQQEEQEPLLPPDEEEDFPSEPVLGRRTFGNFKKKSATTTTTTTTTTTKPSPKRKKADVDADQSNDDEEPLSSGEEAEEVYDDELEKHSTRPPSRPPPSRPEKPQGSQQPRRKEQDDDQLDRMRLQKMRSGGISAAAGLRQPGREGMDGRKYKNKQDRRKW